MTADPANQHGVPSANHQLQNYQPTLHSYLTSAEPQTRGLWLPGAVSC